MASTFGLRLRSLSLQPCMANWFGNLAGLWAGLLLIPLLLLYMMRHRPVRRRVPSLRLWVGAVQAQVATSPFQRLRRSLSLLLMILALLAMVLALAGLRIPDAKRRGLPVTIVLDVTASMAARYENGTRMEAARRLALRAIEASGADRVTLLAWDGTLRPLAQSDAPPGTAADALDAVQAGHKAADDAALYRAMAQLASGTQQPIVLIGDRDPATDDVAFLQAGAPLLNAAIVSASLHDPAPGQMELTLGLELFGARSTQRATIALERLIEDSPELVDARDILLEPGQRVAAVFPISQPGLYRGVLRGTDALAADDTAWARCVPLPVLPVAIGDGVPSPVTRAVEAIAGGMGSVRIAGPSPDAAHISATVRGIRTRLPVACVGPGASPPGVEFADAVDASATPARPSPGTLWRGAGLPDIAVQTAWPITFRGTIQPVLEVDGGTAIALCRRDNGLDDLVLGLPLEGEGAGNLAEQPAWLVLWANWFEYVRGLIDPLPRGGFSTRDIVRVPALDGRETFEVIAPDGSTQNVQPGAGLPTHLPGVYRVNGLDAPVPLLGASLLDAAESDLAVTQGADNDATMAALQEGRLAGGTGPLELAPWLAMAGAFLLITEWALYRRRFPRRAPAGQS